MGKKDINLSVDTQDLFPNLKSYSVDEIMAAGGTTAFAEKLGKNPENIEKRLRKLPKDAFLTDEEAEVALKMLRDGK
jgi:hypothetical protein